MKGWLLIIVLLVGFAIPNQPPSNLEDPKDDTIEVVTQVMKAIEAMGYDTKTGGPQVSQLLTVGIAAGLEFCPHCQQQVSPLSKCSVHDRFHAHLIPKRHVKEL